MKNDQNKSRRNFLKKTGLVATAAVFGGGSLIAGDKKVSESTSLKNTEPIFRTLGKTGIKVPVVSSGAIPTDNDNLVKAMLRSGMVHFDSAYIYGNGKVDAKLGELMQEFNREDYILSTKLKPDTDRSTGLLNEGASIDEFKQQFDTSLERLKTEYVDILYTHAVSKKEIVLNPGYIAVLEEYKKEGKARAIGVSAHNNVPEVLYSAIEAKVYDVVLIAINYLHTEIDEIKKAVAEANKAGLGIVAMKVLAGLRDTKKDFNLIDKKAALKWVLQDENIHTAILSVKTYDDLENYLAVMNDISMTDEENAALDKFRETASLYCSGCTTCIPQCPYGVEIPDYMRAYMYAYGYKDLNKSATTLSGYNSDKAEQCNLCPVCNVQCKSGFNVRERINDINRLRTVPTDLLV